MAKFNLTGKWTGSYRGDEQGDQNPLARVVTFTLTLDQGWFGKFEGIVQDDPASGMPDEGEVEGTLNGNQISFVKRMPVEHISAGDEVISYREYVRRETGADPGFDPPHPPIVYQGMVSSDGKQIEGTWKILRNGKATRTGVWQATRTA